MRLQSIYAMLLEDNVLLVNEIVYCFVTSVILTIISQPSHSRLD